MSLISTLTCSFVPYRDDIQNSAVTNVLRRRRKVVRLCAVLVSFRPRLRECIAFHVDQLRDVIFKKYQTILKGILLLMLRGLLFSPVHQNSDLQIFTFYCKMLYIVCVIVPYVARYCKYSGVCYNERSYNERMLQRTVFINKIRMLQRRRRNTICRRSTRVLITCRAFPL